VVGIEVSDPVAERTPVEALRARSLTVPTDHPEADGTLSWDSTTLVVVEADAGGRTGLGYSYTAAAAAQVVNDLLGEAVIGGDGHSPRAAWQRMRRAVRNVGYPGLVASAISAVDVALWDLEARLLGIALSTLIGRVRERVPVYGSGGFTTYSDEQLERQLREWTEQGIGAVKMKVGSEPERDPERVQAARKAIGPGVALFVDGNGAYEHKQAVAMARIFADYGVTWFEEPVSSDDLAGLQLMRHRAPAGMDIAAGEYGYDLDYFRRMLNADAVDVQQADITRCCGVTGFLQVAGLCQAHHIDLSGHCAPSLHRHAACAALRFRNLEWFHDHVRIEHMLFDGAPIPHGGMIEPDFSRPGLGLEFKRKDAERYAAH
jgi:L-alanine-DL-glutamate epimerase-like enolase superfamily enzyme